MAHIRLILKSSFLKAVQEQRVLNISKLPPRTSPADVKTYFENYGRVFQVYRDIDQFLGVYKGPAFVQFNDLETVNNVLMQRNHVIDLSDVLLYQCTRPPKELNIDNINRKEDKSTELDMPEQAES